MKSSGTRSLWGSWLGVALITGCVFTLMIVSGCGGGGGAKTPDKTVQNLFDATKDKDLDAMIACFAPDIREMFEEMIEVQGKEKVQEQMSHGDQDVGKLKILSTKINGDWADVETSVTAGGKEEKDTVKLHKIKGVWYVDMPEDEKKGMKQMMEFMKNPEKMKNMMEGMAEGMEKSTPKPPTQ